MDRHGIRQCLGTVEVEARENPSGLAAANSQPHQEAGYTSAVVTVTPDPISVLQSGGVHIRPYMTRNGLPGAPIIALRKAHSPLGIGGLTQATFAEGEI
jgi:hypothetical protein